ncbi:MAG: aconitate hydratase AcnA [Acidobacteriota bacterium]
MADSFNTRDRLDVGGNSYEIFSLDRLAATLDVDLSRMPISLKILLENLLRNQDGLSVGRDDVERLARWNPATPPKEEIAFRPARVLLQDFTGVPAVVDLAAMRNTIAELGGDPARINPLQPADLVIDHSVQVDRFGTGEAFRYNAELENQRNRERYAFLRWGQNAFDNFRVVPPDTGIVHQINLEYLACVVFSSEDSGALRAYPDTLVGTDSHTTMINGLGVVGWGVGGIEAEAAMLGQPVSMLVPDVVGFRLAGALPTGTTATDLVLTVTEMLRKKGVVGKFVEFYGPGLSNLKLADRATLANMSPEYGATIAFFPVDDETLAYLRFTGRDEKRVQLVEAYSKAQGLFHRSDSPDPIFSDTIELDLSTVEPCLAGPKRPQDRVPLAHSKEMFEVALSQALEGNLGTLRTRSVVRWMEEGGSPSSPPTAILEPGSEEESADIEYAGARFQIGHGAVVIAAITSCTNTSNPSVMIAAGLLAQKAVGRGLRSQPWVKTSLAPGSQVVTDYLEASGLMKPLEALRFNLVGYGCTTCIGNSGPLPDEIAHAVEHHKLVVASVLSGNRNFEGRINPHCRFNYLASPPLVVAYALAGRMDIDLTSEPIGNDRNGQPVYLRDIWPGEDEISRVMGQAIQRSMFHKRYADVFAGDAIWNSLSIPEGKRFQWDDSSTYIKKPSFFDGMTAKPSPPRDIENARILAILGDSVTTDHISPAGSIATSSPAGRYLIEQGVDPGDFNSYGARRGNHEVMVRGTFANIRLRNQLAPGTEGGWTRYFPGEEILTIYDASVRYKAAGVPLVVLAGHEYGTGSSRDWAAKGTLLLGVRAVIAESFERIHRSNLVGMGILPLQFQAGEDRRTLQLNGDELVSIRGLSGQITPLQTCTIEIKASAGGLRTFTATVRIDTPQEVLYFQHGGILQFVLRQLLTATAN